LSLELPHRSSLRPRRSSRRSFSIPSPGAPFTARPGPMNSFTNFFRSGATLRRSGRELEGAKPPRRRSHDAGERQGPNNAQNLPSAASPRLAWRWQRPSLHASACLCSAQRCRALRRSSISQLINLSGIIPVPVNVRLVLRPRVSSRPIPMNAAGLFQ